MCPSTKRPEMPSTISARSSVLRITNTPFSSTVMKEITLTVVAENRGAGVGDRGYHCEDVERDKRGRWRVEGIRISVALSSRPWKERDQVKIDECEAALER